MVITIVIEVKVVAGARPLVFIVIEVVVKVLPEGPIPVIIPITVIEEDEVAEAILFPDDLNPTKKILLNSTTITILNKPTNNFKRFYKSCRNLQLPKEMRMAKKRKIKIMKAQLPHQVNLKMGKSRIKKIRKTVIKKTKCITIKPNLSSILYHAKPSNEAKVI